LGLNFYLATVITYENYIPEEIKGGMNLGLGTTLPIFLYALTRYQQRQGLYCVILRQGLYCVILHAILHVCNTGFVMWACEIKSRISMAKFAFNKKRVLFAQN
jgi:hypothetical protein